MPVRPPCLSAVSSASRVPGSTSLVARPSRRADPWWAPSTPGAVLRPRGSAAGSCSSLLAEAARSGSRCSFSRRPKLPPPRRSHRKPPRREHPHEPRVRGQQRRQLLETCVGEQVAAQVEDADAILRHRTQVARVVLRRRSASQASRPQRLISPHLRHTTKLSILAEGPRRSPVQGTCRGGNGAYRVAAKHMVEVWRHVVRKPAALQGHHGGAGHGNGLEETWQALLRDGDEAQRELL
eukprot:scaffold7356_cov249-Pinguiococcus_pyrenoidosus.AAC.5